MSLRGDRGPLTVIHRMCQWTLLSRAAMAEILPVDFDDVLFRATSGRTTDSVRFLKFSYRKCEGAKMRLNQNAATTFGVAIIALGVVGCGSGEGDKAPPGEVAAVADGAASAQAAEPAASPAPAGKSVSAASVPPAAMEAPAGGTSAANGADLYKSKTCIACHGADANTPIMPTYPKIAGQNEQYLIEQMKDIKNGARSNAQSAAMKGVMHLVSDEEIAAIAKWLSGLE